MVIKVPIAIKKIGTRMTLGYDNGVETSYKLHLFVHFFVTFILSLQFKLLKTGIALLLVLLLLKVNLGTPKLLDQKLPML